MRRRISDLSLAESSKEKPNIVRHDISGYRRLAYGYDDPRAPVRETSFGALRNRRVSSCGVGYVERFNDVVEVKRLWVGGLQDGGGIRIKPSTSK
jgi:hypothetical protein